MAECTCNRQQFQGHSASCAVFFPQPIQGEADQLHDKVRALQADLARVTAERDGYKADEENAHDHLSLAVKRESKLVTENRRLRAALEVYASPESWGFNGSNTLPHTWRGPKGDDLLQGRYGYERAQAALRGEEVPSA